LLYGARQANVIGFFLEDAVNAKMTSKQRADMNREVVRAECAVLGIDIEPRGKAIHLRSQHVDLMVADLSWVSLNDLKANASPIWRAQVAASRNATASQDPAGAR
jgi:hypothetical protein